jgi:hypothetical protein
MVWLIYQAFDILKEYTALQFSSCHTNLWQNDNEHLHVSNAFAPICLDNEWWTDCLHKKITCSRNSIPISLTTFFNHRNSAAAQDKDKKFCFS